VVGPWGNGSKDLHQLVRTQKAGRQDVFERALPVGSDPPRFGQHGWGRGTPADLAMVDDLLRTFRAAVSRGEGASLVLLCGEGQVKLKLNVKPMAAAGPPAATRSAVC
jgi:hypothetical protein